MLLLKNKVSFPLLRKGKGTLLLLCKSNSRFFLSVFLIFSNVWIIKIFSGNFFLGLVLSILALILTLNYTKRFILVTAMSLLLLMQLYTTSPASLTNLDNDEQRVQQERIRSYPLTYINLHFKVLWLKPAEWIEKNNLVIAFSRIEENLFGALDLNYYFFGGFPRNNPSDFEKFPFVLLPFFIAGVFKLAVEKEYLKLGLTFFVPLAIVSGKGVNNPFGLFAFFPFFIISFLEGIIYLAGFINRRKFGYVILIILIILIFIMQINYAKN